MQNTETGYASSVNVTKSRTRRKVTGEPRTLKGVRVVRRGGARKRVSRLRETPRRAPYPVNDTPGFTSNRMLNPDVSPTAILVERVGNARAARTKSVTVRGEP